MSDLDRLEHEVALLAEREDITPERACALITDIDTAVHRARDLKAALEAVLIKWMPEAGVKELVIGTRRYFVTDKKKEKDRDVRRTVEAIHQETGGDFDAFCDCLSSNAIKIGQARKVLGEKFSQFFETTYEKDLEQKPVKALVALDSRFVK